MLRSTIAYAVLLTIYGVTLVIAKSARLISWRRHTHTGRIAVTGTFHNQGWFLSHMVPLSQSGVREVILVTDEPQPAVEGVRLMCPPRWARKLLGRALSKLLWMAFAGLRHRPDLYMGYHILPGAVSALVVARLFGRPACYQMTGGPVEFMGGGANNENRLMSCLRRPSALLERLATAVVREFDLVIVRGSRARRYLGDQGFGGRTHVIPGSIEAFEPTNGQQPHYDLVFVGRMTEIKQPGQFLEIVALVQRHIPNVRAAMVGDGPLKDMLSARAADLGIEDCVDCVGQLSGAETMLARARVFVLTSRSEGLSIAMLEAMAAGLPVVVADVGELRDVVVNGQTGWLVSPGAIDEYAGRIVALLSDEVLRCRMGQRARQVALQLASRENVARLWSQAIGDWCGLERGPGAPSAELASMPLETN